jgi:hypothetical protein
MKQQLRMMTVAATALVMAASFAMTMQSASAEEWCLGGSTVGTQYCEYTTMAQCQAAASGFVGTCARNPFAAESARSAYAFQPKPAPHKAKKPVH